MRDERSEEEREEARFIERLAASYTPEPLQPARRAELDEALSARIERGRKVMPWAAALGAAAAVALLALLVTSGSLEPTPGPEERAALQPVTDWEYVLLAPEGASEGEDAEDAAELPPDYVAIASSFLDG
jgi:hypothetical protein